MAIKTQNRTTPRKITPTKAGLASKNATTERETAKKEKAGGRAPRPATRPKEAVDLLAEKPKPVRRAPVPGIKGFKPLTADLENPGAGAAEAGLRARARAGRARARTGGGGRARARRRGGGQEREGRPSQAADHRPRARRRPGTEALPGARRLDEDEHPRQRQPADRRGDGVESLRDPRLRLRAREARERRRRPQGRKESARRPAAATARRPRTRSSCARRS